MFTALLAGLAALAGGYFLGKKKGEDKNSSNVTNTTTTTDTETEDKNKAQNVYNYNYLNDSNTGNTLFSSKKKTNRAIFGTQS